MVGDTITVLAVVESKIHVNRQTFFFTLCLLSSNECNCTALSHFSTTAVQMDGAISYHFDCVFKNVFITRNVTNISWNIHDIFQG